MLALPAWGTGPLALGGRGMQYDEVSLLRAVRSGWAPAQNLPAENRLLACHGSVLLGHVLYEFPQRLFGAQMWQHLLRAQSPQCPLSVQTAEWAQGLRVLSCNFCPILFASDPPLICLLYCFFFFF